MHDDEKEGDENDEVGNDGDGDGESGAEYGLVCEFLNESIDYMLGVEMGMIFQLMQHTDEVKELIHAQNFDQIKLLTERMGWTMVAHETVNEDFAAVHLKQHTDEDDAPL